MIRPHKKKGSRASRASQQRSNQAQESGSQVRNVQEASNTQSPWMVKTGFATTYGPDYEVAICSLLILRALRLKADFFLAANVAVADKFDDVVFFYRLENDDGLKYRAILLQAKHKDNYTVQKLSLKSPFDLNLYFESFKKIKNLLKQSVKVENREIELQEISLVLYTNTGCVIDDAALDVTESESPEMKHLQDFLNTGGKLIRITEAKQVGLREGQETSEFLGHLLLCTQQMSVKTADHFLEQELCKTLKLTSLEYTKNLNSVLKDVINKWWSEKKTVRYLTAQSEEWIKVLQTHFNSDTLIVDRELNLNYTEDALQEFVVDAPISKMSWISVKDKYQAKTVRSRFLRVHNNSVVVGVRYLESHLEEVKALWGMSVCPTLALDMFECSQEEGSLLLQRLKKAVQNDACKVLVVIAKEKPATIAKEKPATDSWNFVEPVATWSVLDQPTRERLLNVQVELQGELVTMLNVVGSDVGDVMSDEVINSLSVSEKVIKLGEPSPSPFKYYVHRCLQRIISNRINFEQLINKNTLIFMKYWHLDDSTTISRTFRCLYPTDLMRLYKIEGPVVVRRLESEQEIRNLCSRFRVRGLFGETDSEGFRSNVTEIVPFTWICEEKIVVIEGVPGVGKSYFVSAMCSTVKQKFPEAWVLRIDMGRHSNYFKKRDFTSSSDIKEFLLKGLSKNLSKLEKDLLEHSLKVTGNVFLFLDAFDEISPDYTDKCCKLLKGIADKFNFRQMVVTTRPVTRKNVQKELETEAFTLPVFSVDEQTLFLESFFAAKGQDFDKEELSSLRESAGPVLEIPLLCRMAAEVPLKHHNQILLKCVNPWRKVLLYKRFGEQSVLNGLSEKFGFDISISGMPNLLEPIQKKHFQDLQGLAAMKLMPVSSLNVSSETPEKKLGLIVYTGETWEFEHQTFAEYFLGCWLASQRQGCSQELLRKVLLRDGFQLSAATFSWSLFKDLPLHMAVAQGDEVAVREHLSSWTTDGGGRSALHVAAMTQGKHHEVWELLVSSSKDLNRKDDVFNLTAIMYAEMSENWEFIDFMLVKGVSLEGLKFVTNVNAAKEILIHVTKKDLTNLCQCILGLHKGVFNDAESNLFLCKAASNNSTDVLKVLIEMGHLLTLPNSKGWTPLHEASRHGHMEAVRLLIDEGADPNIRSKDGSTALMLAVEKGHLDVVKVLIENGANLNVKTEYGETASMMAARKGHVDVVKVLMENGADPNVNNYEGETALMEAARRDHVMTVEYLLTNGADPRITNAKGKTIFEICSEEVLTIMSKHAVYFPIDYNG